MEATSLMTSIMFLKALLSFNFDESNRELFNQKMLNVNDQNLLFVRHHYSCDRVDTQFWLDYKNNPLPDTLKKMYNPKTNEFKNLGNLDIRNLIADAGNISNFNWDSWIMVHKGKTKKYSKNLI